MMFMSFLLNPIASHMYTMKAIQKLYLVKTQDNNMFLPKQSEKFKKKKAQRNKIMATLTPEQQADIKQNITPKIDICTSINLFLKSFFCCAYQDKWSKILEKGSEKIEKDFNIVRIVKTLRNLKYLITQHHEFDDKIKILMKNHEDHLIDMTQEQ